MIRRALTFAVRLSLLSRSALAQDEDAGAEAAPAPTTIVSAEPPKEKAPETKVVTPEEKPEPDPIVGLKTLLVVQPLGKEGPKFLPRGEIFGQYAIGAQYSPGGTSDWFHQFEMTRAFAGMYAEWEGAHGGVLLESTRSANDGALIGVAGNTYVMNVREAFAGYTHRFERIGDFTARIGIVPTLVIPTLEEAWRLRVIEKTWAERSTLENPADVGATVRYDAAQHWGSLQVGFFNGEGYQRPELNRGKNLSFALQIRPFAPIEVMRPLSLFVSFTNGSLGTAAVRGDRLTAGLLWTGDRISGGAALTYGWGVLNDGDKQSFATEIFSRVEPIKNLLLGARFGYVVRDTRVTGDVITQILGTIGYRIVTPLETYLAVVRTIPASIAQTALPGQDTFDVRVIARFWF